MVTSLRRMMALIAVVALVAGACGDDDGGGDTTEATQAAPATTAPAAPAGLAGDLDVVITWSGSEGEAFDASLEGFRTANPGLNVNVIQIPFGELSAQLTQQFASGSGPDVTVALPGLIRLFAGEGFLMPLDGLWDEWVGAGQYTESLRGIASADGTAYGVWFKANVNALQWYSPPQFSDLGLSVPTTWAEYEDVLDALQAAGVEPYAVGAADQWASTQWWDPFLARVGGAEAHNGLVDGSVSWDDPRVVESFQALGDFIADYFPPDALDRGFIEALCARTGGDAALQNQGAFVNLITTGECDPDLVPGEDYSFFLMPKFDESAPLVQFVSGDLFAVSAGTDNPDAALALARYLGSAEAQAVWAARGGFVAPNADVPISVYPDANDQAAAELWPRDPGVLAVYDLDDFIGGEIQSALREALQDFFRDQDVDKIVNTMVEVDNRVRG